MSRRPRRRNEAIFKAKVALDAIKAEKTLAELAKAHDVHPNQIVDWKNQLLERAASVFGAESATPPTVDLKELHAKIVGIPVQRDRNQRSRWTGIPSCRTKIARCSTI